MWMMYVLVFGAALATVLLLLLLTGAVLIREDRVGVVSKRFSFSGKRLPQGRVVAVNGEPGYQAATLPPGFYFGYWSWQYKVDKAPLTVVPPGHIGLVLANDGDALPVDHILCQAVECSNFQDGAQFLLSGGQKGPPDDCFDRWPVPHQPGAVRGARGYAAPQD